MSDATPAAPRGQPVDSPPPSAATARRPRRGWFWRFKWTVRIGFVLFIAGAFMFGCDGFFYYPSRQMVGTPTDLGLNYEEVMFPARDGVKLSGWFLPARGKPRGTIVHFHGNAENMSTHVNFVAWAPPEGYNLFVFDYRGYGKSEGSVTRAGTISDGHGALDYVLTRGDVDPKRLFVLGQSLGGAVATAVVAERPEVRALILDSTFSSYRRIATLHLQRTLVYEWAASSLATSLVSTAYEPIDCIAKIAPRPVFIIASERDEICYPELARELFDAAKDPKQFWMVADAEHTGAFFVKPSEAIQRVTKFLDDVSRGD